MDLVRQSFFLIRQYVEKLLEQIQITIRCGIVSSYLCLDDDLLSFEWQILEVLLCYDKFKNFVWRKNIFPLRILV